ncbi:uncharacterized metal-binding protein YceD (DUF177 family) [Amaricoccus macauensis]|uniref:Uncharacterized metal-binding protein YceD (DUF177 family) n=1 Tax=Amaricoccus macauensis TaxID=57001 RepID=A0A840SLT4_9RHOB|nr:DUF177 domain-containing protein [Amaricoccus macauensis]MBB5220826.1 uncharacterized metal-binding protein YceD (DUF177 family) [Amaricoccus macauensis]
MPELISHAADNPEFARVVELRQIRDLSQFAFDISPQPAEAVALAELLGARAVRKLRFSGRLTPVGKGGWDLDAELGATVVQTCVVSLEPVTTRVDERVHRAFLPETASSAEIVVSPDEDDEVEPLGDRIDLGRIAIEALALALPAYPRKAGATLEAGDDDDADRPRPFAALAALREKLDPGDT